MFSLARVCGIHRPKIKPIGGALFPICSTKCTMVPTGGLKDSLRLRASALYFCLMSTTYQAE